MLTLQELKQIVDVPYPGMKIRTAKKLKKDMERSLPKRAWVVRQKSWHFKMAMRCIRLVGSLRYFRFVFVGNINTMRNRRTVFRKSFLIKGSGISVWYWKEKTRLSRNQECERTGLDNLIQ